MAEQADESGVAGKAKGDASPLTGCYLLIVIGEPASAEHKELILQRISKGFLSWPLPSDGCDLNAELQLVVNQQPKGDEAKSGEHLIQYVTEHLVTEVLINAQVNTLQQCVKNLLSSYTRHKHIIHAGYAFSGSGSWVLQDGTFSYLDLLDALQEAEVQWLFQSYENSISVHVHCAPEGEWGTGALSKESTNKFAKVLVNPDDKCSLQPGMTNFVAYVAQFLRPQPLGEVLEPSDVVGSIRFSRPTLYVFPGGQGDSALFGVNGFNMLVDGGFSRRACFWDFVRHLDRVDALLVTRLNNSNMSGVSSLLKRKAMSEVYPHIGHIFCNVSDKKQSSPDGLKDQDGLVINVVEENQAIVENLKQLNVKPQQCFRDPNLEPVNLYHKVGHGRLDMYVVNPSRDSREVKEFLHQWNAQTHQKSRGKIGDRELTIPLPNLMSICALLVWQPADPADSITRILFPGSSPQSKIFEGLDKLKHLEVLKYSVCTEKSLSSIIPTKKPPATPPKFIPPKPTKVKEKYTPPKIERKTEARIIEKKDEKKAAEKKDEKKAAEKKDEKKGELIKAAEKKEERKAELIKAAEKREEKKAELKAKPAKKDERKVTVRTDEKKEIQKTEPRRPLSSMPSRKTEPSKATESSPKQETNIKAKVMKDASNKKAIEAKNIATKAATAATAKRELLPKKKPLPTSPAKKTVPKKTTPPKKDQKVPDKSVVIVPPPELKTEKIEPVPIPVEDSEQQEEKTSLDEKQSLEEEIRAEKDELLLLESKSEDRTPPTELVESSDETKEPSVPETEKEPSEFPSEEQVEKDLDEEVVRKVGLTDLVAEPLQKLIEQKRRESFHEEEEEVREEVHEVKTDELEVQPEVHRKVSLTDLVAEPLEHLIEQKRKESAEEEAKAHLEIETKPTIERKMSLTDLVAEPIEKAIEHKTVETNLEAAPPAVKKMSLTDLVAEPLEHLADQKTKELAAHPMVERKVSLTDLVAEPLEHLADQKTKELTAHPMVERKVSLTDLVAEPLEHLADQKAKELAAHPMVERKVSLTDLVAEPLEQAIEHKVQESNLEAHPLVARKMSLTDLVAEPLEHAIEHKVQEQNLEPQPPVERKMSLTDLVAEPLEHAIEHKVEEANLEAQPPVERKMSLTDLVAEPLEHLGDMIRKNSHVEAEESVKPESRKMSVTELVSEPIESFVERRKDSVGEQVKEVTLDTDANEDKFKAETQVQEESDEEDKAPAPVKISSAVEAFGADIREALMKTREMMLGGGFPPSPTHEEKKAAEEAAPSPKIQEEEKSVSLKPDEKTRTPSPQLEEIVDKASSPKIVEQAESTSVTAKHEVPVESLITSESIKTLQTEKELKSDEEEELVIEEPMTTQVSKLLLAEKEIKSETDSTGSKSPQLDEQLNVRAHTETSPSPDIEHESEEEEVDAKLPEILTKPIICNENALEDSGKDVEIKLEELHETKIDKLSEEQLEEETNEKEGETPLADTGRGKSPDVVESKILVEAEKVESKEAANEEKEEKAKDSEPVKEVDRISAFIPSVDVAPPESQPEAEQEIKGIQEPASSEVKEASGKVEKPLLEMTMETTSSPSPLDPHVIPPQQKFIAHHDYPKTPDEVADLPTDDEEAPALFRTSEGSCTSEEGEGDQDGYDIDVPAPEEYQQYEQQCLRETMPLHSTEVMEEEKEEDEIETGEPAVFTTLSAHHAEMVTLSEGTSPSAPLSPKSPVEKAEKVYGVEEKLVSTLDKTTRDEEEQLTEEQKNGDHKAEVDENKDIQVKEEKVSKEFFMTEEQRILASGGLKEEAVLSEEQQKIILEEEENEFAAILSQQQERTLKEEEMKVASLVKEKERRISLEKEDTSHAIKESDMSKLVTITTEMISDDLQKAERAKDKLDVKSEDEDDEDIDEERERMMIKMSAPIDPMTQSMYGEDEMFASDTQGGLTPVEQLSPQRSASPGKDQEATSLPANITVPLPKSSASDVEIEQKQYDLNASRRSFSDGYTDVDQGQKDDTKENVYTTVDGTTKRLDMLGKEEDSSQSPQLDKKSIGSSEADRRDEVTSSEDEIESKSEGDEQEPIGSIHVIDPHLNIISDDKAGSQSDLAESRSKSVSPQRSSPDIEKLQADKSDSERRQSVESVGKGDTKAEAMVVESEKNALLFAQLSSSAATTCHALSGNRTDRLDDTCQTDSSKLISDTYLPENRSLADIQETSEPSKPLTNGVHVSEEKQQEIFTHRSTVSEEFHIANVPESADEENKDEEEEEEDVPPAIPPPAFCTDTLSQKSASPYESESEELQNKGNRPGDITHLSLSAESVSIGKSKETVSKMESTLKDSDEDCGPQPKRNSDSDSTENNNHENTKKSMELSSMSKGGEVYPTQSGKLLIERRRSGAFEEKEVEGRSSDDESSSIKSGNSTKEQVEGEYRVACSTQKQRHRTEEGDDEFRSPPQRFENGSRNGARPPVVPHGGGQAAQWEETEAHPEWTEADDDEEDPQRTDEGIENKDWPAEVRQYESRGSDSGGESSPHGFEMDSPGVRKTPFDFRRPTLEGRYLPDLKRHDATPSSASSTQLSTPSSESGIVKDEKNKTPIDDWGEPMGLPSPPPPPGQDPKPNGIPNGKVDDNHPKRTATSSPRRTFSAKTNKDVKDLRPRRSESPKPVIDMRKQALGKTGSMKSLEPSHFYVDLAYVPHHGNPHYSNVEFFKRVRARYYVLSGINPSKEVLNSLLEAKQSWEDKDLEVTIIPTYDTDTLGYWVALNEDTLTKNKIDLAPSASRCTINLQDHETSCSAYRLEF